MVARQSTKLLLWAQLFMDIELPLVMGDCGKMTEIEPACFMDEMNSIEIYKEAEVETKARKEAQAEAKV